MLMINPANRYLTLAAFASFLVSFAAAQVGSAVAAPIRTATHAPETVHASAASAPSGAVDVRGTHSSAAAAHHDNLALDAVDLTAITTDTDSAAANASATSRGRIAASLHTADRVRQICEVSGPARDALLTEIDSSREASYIAVVELRRAGRELRGTAREKFETALDNVRDRERTLRQSIRRARLADGDAAAEARAQLASDYQAYADAVAEIETVTENSVQTTGSADH